ncbi:hypothetical protein BGZ65_005103 [Modicella reniformis]|uniref:Uncharacterized protein n=1 Tax=Modicella reniformis TaxID=1440133 RepID=A0A9P6SV58_9FUNG|nr:hypothetical protein BGZ65_005103 [Modicella reniformis]
MNRDRDPTQVISLSSPASPTDEAAGHSKIKATALLLKQKVAGTNSKPQKLPNKISHPFGLASSAPSSSFSSPTSPSSFAIGSSSSPLTPAATRGVNSDSVLSEDNGHGNYGRGGTIVSGARGDMDIKSMISAREDPAISRNKMAPPGTQPVPAPQKRDIRAGMTRVQLSQPPQVQSGQLAKQQDSSPEATVATMDSKGSNDSSNNDDADLGRRSARRRNGSKALVPSQFAAPSATSSAPLFMQAFQDPTTLAIPALLITDTSTADTDNNINININTNTNTNTNTNINTTNTNTINDSTSDNCLALSVPSGEKPVAPIPLHAQSDTFQVNVVEPRKNSLKTTATSSSSTTAVTSPTTPKESPTTEAFLTALGQQRPSMKSRRHTTSSGSSSSSSLFSHQHGTPPVPPLPHHQPMSVANPTLRQLQTPKIPANLVQARIIQQEEQKRRDEELAKVPITANLRTVKKIQAVLVEDVENDGQGASRLADTLSSPSPSPSDSLLNTSNPKPTRPRSKTATSGSVTGKQRGDRNHVEPVLIPKKLAEQFEHILGRKLAGKGNEEEARKAAEPIVRGQPRKRAVTSSHIRNLVSSWDHKVEEAKEITSEAEQIRLFLEERSAAHAELPKFSKVPLRGSELLQPLPSLPPPPPSTELNGVKKTPRVGGHTKATRSLSEDVTSSTHEATIMPVESISQPITVPETFETKRSGQVLDSKALISRPRRTGVRRPTVAL